MVSLAYIFVGLRIAVRVHWKQKHLIISDIWLVLAALCVLGLVICDTITYRMGRMADPTPRANVELRKIWFAMNYLFDAGLYLPKLSMVAIYYHLIPMHFHGLRRALHFIGFFVGSSFFITFFSDTFWCGPHPSVQCLTSLSGREKAGLVGIFTLGAVTIGVSSGRFATMMMKGNDISLYVWGSTEFAVAIMIVAATALRPLIRKAWEATTFASKHSLSGSGRRAPRFFKSGSGGTGDSIKELKPGISIEHHHHHHHQPHQHQSSSWPDRITPIAEGG
ncbi:hypothetical protein PG997_006793 [Apiospora hydei]|uniref:Rhodopsin domain-containing protein n=1 Tax=Apiospora hydei TaxID=1337664 RepID=A0ABR1WR51_9PEZI